jgi:hypothetical protein
MEKEKVIDFIKRHATAISFITVFIVSILLIMNFKSDKQERLNDIYHEMGVKEDSVKSAVEAKFTGMPIDFVEYEKMKSVKSLELTPEFKCMQKEINTLENSKNNMSIFPYLLLGLLGMVIVPFMAGVSLYFTTKVNFVKMVFEGNSDAIRLLITIIKTYSYIWIGSMLLYGIYLIAIK